MKTKLYCSIQSKVKAIKLGDTAGALWPLILITVHLLPSTGCIVIVCFGNSVSNWGWCFYFFFILLYNVNTSAKQSQYPWLVLFIVMVNYDNA